MDGIPGLLNSMSHFHDFHHKHFDRAFGVIGLLDWLHGTGYDEYHDPHLKEWDAHRRAAAAAAVGKEPDKSARRSLARGASPASTRKQPGRKAREQKLQ